MNQKHFDISRKIIAASTTDGWQHVPHYAAVYEAETDLLVDVVKEL